MKQNSVKKRKIGVWYVIAAIIAIVGTSFLMYPTMAGISYNHKVAAQKTEFLKWVSQDEGPAAPDDPHENPYQLASAKSPSPSSGNVDREGLYQFLKARNIALYESGQYGLVDAFSYQTAGVDLSEYGILDNCIGFVAIPSINVEMPIYLGANSDNLSKGAVHLTQTSYPIGGANSNAVIAAHRGSTEPMLRDIHKIQIGDEIIITNFKEILIYRAVEVKIIPPSDVNKVMIQKGRDLVTLLSCDPPGKNYQRYALYCERVG